MGTYWSRLVCHKALTTPMPLVTSCLAPEYCQFTSSVLPLRLLSMTTSSKTRMPGLACTSFLAAAHKSLGCMRSATSHREMLSWDKARASGATSLKDSAEYLSAVTSRNAQYNSREHLERDMFVFPCLQKNGANA